jgi:hypothetical protein
MDSKAPQEKRKATDHAKKPGKVFHRGTGTGDKQHPPTLQQKPKNGTNNNGRPHNEGTAGKDAGGKENRPPAKTKAKEYYRNIVSDHR